MPKQKAPHEAGPSFPKRNQCDEDITVSESDDRITTVQQSSISPSVIKPNHPQNKLTTELRQVVRVAPIASCQSGLPDLRQPRRVKNQANRTGKPIGYISRSAALGSARVLLAARFEAISR